MIKLTDDCGVERPRDYEIERRIQRNLPLCDGTPRIEKGYRAFVDYYKPTSERADALHWKVCCQSPLLNSREEAETWNAGR